MNVYLLLLQVSLDVIGCLQRQFGIFVFEIDVEATPILAMQLFRN